MEVKARPGSVAQVRVRVRNDGPKADGFFLSILGPLAPWASVEPPTVRIAPTDVAEVRVSFRPPRQAGLVAGAQPFGVSVRSASDPGVAVVQEGALQLSPFVALAGELEPRMSRGRRTGWHTLSVRNVGNEPARVSARASSPDDALRVAFEPAEQGIAPGEARSFRVRVRPRRLRKRGAPVTMPYLIELSDGLGGTEAVPAVFEGRALISGWALVLLVLLVLGAVALAAAVTLGAFGA